MSFLQEFSKIIILKDTPDTRANFGSPIDATELANPIRGINTAGTFYKKLVDTSFRHGWYPGYPNLQVALNSGTPAAGADGSSTNAWVSAIRNNILQSIGTEENVTEGYNLTPVSSGTAIIKDDTLYLGSTSSVTYTSITGEAGDDEVVVNGTFSTTVTPGTKVKLTNVTGMTGLSVNTTYYAYAGNSTSFKLASSLLNANSGTPITNTTGSASSGTANLTTSGYTYEGITSFTSPTPTLNVGDYIFWGEDPNSLKIGGKILKVYTSSDPEWDNGARYLFEKNTSVPTDDYGTGPYTGEPIPQDIYYYRKSWNGKGIKNDTLTGFYVVIGVEQETPGNYNIYPYLGDDNFGGTNQQTGQTYTPNSGEQVIDTLNPINGHRCAFTDLIRIKRISNKFKSDETDNSGFGEEIIPCTIHRTSNFFIESSVGSSGYDYDTNGLLRSILRGNDFAANGPLWVAYYINPYGGSAVKLDKNSTYVIEINERLPATSFNGTGSGTNAHLFFANGSC